MDFKKTPSINGEPIATLADASIGLINVKNSPYGAVGDGSTDDYTAIQAALNAVSATAGGTVVFPPGRYKIVSPGSGVGLVVSDIPAIHLVGLGGKPFQGDKTRTPNTAGATLEGATSGMTVLKVEATAGALATHQGPTIENLGFTDILTVTGCMSTSSTVSNVAGAAWTSPNSGTITYTITNATLNAAIVPGAVIFVYGYKTSKTSEGSPGTYNGRFTVASTTATTIVVTGTAGATTIADPGAASSGTESNPVIRIAPSMRLLELKKITRSYLRRVNWFGGVYGLYLDATTTDVSWAKVDHCTGVINDHCFYAANTGATTIYIDGGNYQYTNDQTVVDFPQSGNFLKIWGSKFDSLLTNRSAYAIKVVTGAHLSIDNNNFELESEGYGVKFGQPESSLGAADGGSCYGSMKGNTFKWNAALSGGYTNGTRPATAILVDGEALVDGGSSTMTFDANSFTGMGTCYKFTVNTRHCKVIGGAGMLVDRGIDNVGVLNEFTNFTHSRNNSLIDDWIKDTGTSTTETGCHDYADGDSAPAFSRFPTGTGFTLESWTVRKKVAADSNAVNNSTTLVNVNSAGTAALALAVGISEVWLVRYYLRGSAPSTSSDFKFGFTGPSGADLKWGGLATYTSGDPAWGTGGTGSSPTTELSIGDTLATASFNGIRPIGVGGIYIGGGTAGTLQIQFAQNNPVSENTIIKANSIMIADRIA